MPDSKECVYCGRKKPNDEFSLEHIWPDALGGDSLHGIWQTHDVCHTCNSMSGVFVDGAFIKSFFVSNERATDAPAYLPRTDSLCMVPLNYLGIVQNIRAAEGEAIDFWVCTGANILHLRPEGEKLWSTYAGGDPRSASKRSRAGRVIVGLTSAEPYWICSALTSVKKHFAKADRFVTGLELPANATNFRKLDARSPQQADDLRITREFEALQSRGESVHARVAAALHADCRFLAKVALGIGYTLFGVDFLATAYRKELRKVFREADHKKRNQLRVRGSGFLGSIDLGGVAEKLRWPGGWQLTLLHPSDKLGLMITAPSGRAMSVMVTEDAELLDRLGSTYRDGQTWIVVPTAQRGIGPLPYGNYIAHMLGHATIDVLQSLEDLRGDPSRLPAIGIDRIS